MKAEDIKNLKIAIVGAGYGGAAAAKALSLLGADVKVYEQAPQMGEVGAGIGLRPATMARFRQWGIFDAIAQVSSPSDYFEILTATGEPIMKDTWPEFGERSRRTSFTAATSSKPFSACFPRAWCSSATGWRPSRTRAAAPS